MGKPTISSAANIFIAVRHQISPQNSKLAKKTPHLHLRTERLTYDYYHSDHLGSASYITDLDGQLVQHIEYVPFGEVFLEERNNRWNTPYLFNGKELDEQTGLYYYGARYYDPRVSQWLSVDPLALYDPVKEVEHYIDGQHNGGYNNPRNMSVYGYCYQNPVRYLDPNGKQADVVYAVKNPTAEIDDTIIINAADDISNKPNVMTVVSHGGPHGARVVENNKRGEKIKDSNTFNSFMTRDSEKWKNREKIGNLVVVMYGCNLARDRVNKKGKKMDTRLQMISKGHPDQVFIGSTSSVQFFDIGILDGILGPENGGKWRVYKAGVLIDEYGAGWDPNTYKEKWFSVDIQPIESTDVQEPAEIDDLPK